MKIRLDLPGTRRTANATIRRMVVAPLLLAAASACGPRDYRTDVVATATDFYAGMQAYHRGDFAGALDKIRPFAEQGNAYAQYRLGLMHEEGEGGLVADAEEAVHWYRKAADGNTDAQYRLGLMHEEGEGGLVTDAQRAVYWYRKAAIQENAYAQNRLGLMYHLGLTADDNDEKAAFWYLKAAKQGNANAQYNLGFMHEEGEGGLVTDAQRAVYWYRKAAIQEHPFAQNRLGLMYERGEVVSSADNNDKEAVHWFKRAAKQGNAYAQWNLGLMQYNGRGGLAKDAEEAASWYLKAAMQGLPRAQYYLGGLHLRGEGVREDYIEAYAWFNLAAAAGYESAEEGQSAKEARLIARKMLTLGQINDAHARSRKLEAQIESDHGSAAPTGEKKTLKIRSTGSGYLIGDGNIVTNHHVINGCARVTVGRPGKSYDAEAWAANPGDDLALLQAPEAAGEAARFSRSSDVQLGDPVTVAGYPLSSLLPGLNVTKGNVSRLSPGDDPKHLQIDAAVQGGSSGGPLLDAAGNVIGTVVGQIDAVSIAQQTGKIPQAVNFAIRGAVVLDFLKTHNADYSLRASNMKLDQPQIAERARTFTVAVQCWK